MSAPVMVKAAALAALLAGVVSCNAPGDGPADTPATPKETQKPKKSWSELIVGKWQFVKTENPPSPPTLSALAEFTSDGKVTTNISEPRRGFKLVRTGTYKVDGATLRIEYAPCREEDGEALESTIESLTKDELITLGELDGLGRRMRTIFKRDVKK